MTPIQRFRMVTVLPMAGSLMRTTALFLGLALLIAAPPTLASEPAVARPSFPIDGEIRTQGLVFFIATDGPHGAAAVGTAHTFDLLSLARVKRGQFVLGHSQRVVAQTSGFLVPPGRPYDARAGGFADDFVVYRLDARPTGVRLLTLADTRARPGTRVRILGVPSSVPRDEDDLFGNVLSTTLDRINVTLDVPYNLRGWGGAPVLDATSGAVVGMLQASFARGSTTEVVIAPVQRIRAALARPLDAGRGRPFAKFALRATAPRQRSAASGRTSAPRGTSTKPDGPLIQQGFADGPRMHLDVEYPPDGAVIGNSSCGAFVSGRAAALHGEMRQFDVMLVIDTSQSTEAPAGSDINGNGVVGKIRLGGFGSLLARPMTDPGDSILAAEIAAAHQLLRGLDPRSTRVGVVSFAGEANDGGRGFILGGRKPPAVTVQRLTDDFSKVEHALRDILIRAPGGNTHMAAGLDQATIELRGLPGALSRENTRSEKIVLFFTDGQPTLPYGNGFERDNVDAVLRAANRAARASIQIHSFAIGPDALEGPVATVEMANRTDGFFTPVRHPADLVDVVEEVSFANLENVRLRSVTTGNPAEHFRATADGSWAGFVALMPGQNEIEVHARTTDGLEKTRKLKITMREGSETPPVPNALVVARNRLLEDCLRTLKQVRVSAEQERTEEVRKALMVEIERERAEARTRAADQSKRLRLDVEDGDADTPAN